MPPRGMVMKKERPRDTGRTLRRLWSYLARQHRGLVIVLAATVLGAAFNLLGPYLIGRAIDQYITPHNYHGLVWICLVLLAVYLLGSLTSWIQAYVMAGVSQRMVWELRSDLFARFQRLPVRFFDRTPHGELMSRTTNDVENVSNTLGQSLTQVISSAITVIGAFIMMLVLNGWLTLVALVTVPLIFGTSKFISSRTRKLFKEQQAALGELNGFIEETISGQRAVKLYRREEMAKDRFAGINSRLKQAGSGAQNLSGLMGPLMNILGHLNFILIAAVGGWMAVHDWTTVGVIVSFLNYSRQFSSPLNELANQYNTIQSGVAGAERVFEIIDTPSEYDGEEGLKQLPPIEGKVEFRNVTFSYKREAVTLRDVSFTAEPGSVIALVGPTGAGKTTIVNLLTRFYDIDSGSILIDGEDIRGIDKTSLRSQLGIVLQDAYVFSDTIRENIRYGRLGATDEEVEAAARLANADGFIRKMPHGYETMLTSDGGNLSHGQRQLLTIARAILADHAILILDEATSSVDTRTEMHIQEAMNTLMKGRTSFVIAHRLSTIRDADQILVIRAGEIAERGTHDELLRSKGFYHSLYYSNQLQESS